MTQILPVFRSSIADKSTVFVGVPCRGRKFDDVVGAAELLAAGKMKRSALCGHFEKAGGGHRCHDRRLQLCGHFVARDGHHNCRMFRL